MKQCAVGKDWKREEHLRRTGKNVRDTEGNKSAWKRESEKMEEKS